MAAQPQRSAGKEKLGEYGPCVHLLTVLLVSVARIWSAQCIRNSMVNSPPDLIFTYIPLSWIPPANFKSFLAQTLKTDLRGKLSIGNWCELTFSLHHNGRGPSILLILCTGLPSLATDDYFWQLVLHQSLPLVIPIPLLFPTSPLLLDHAKIKSAQNKVLDQEKDCTVSIPCRPAHLPKELCCQCPFNILYIGLHIPLEADSKITGLGFIALFSPDIIHFAMSTSYLSSSFRNPAVPWDHLGLLRAYGGLRDAQAVETRSLRQTNIYRLALCYRFSFCHPNRTWRVHW